MAAVLHSRERESENRERGEQHGCAGIDLGPAALGRACYLGSRAAASALLAVHRVEWSDGGRQLWCGEEWEGSVVLL